MIKGNANAQNVHRICIQFSSVSRNVAYAFVVSGGSTGGKGSEKSDSSLQSIFAFSLTHNPFFFEIVLWVV